MTAPRNRREPSTASGDPGTAFALGMLIAGALLGVVELGWILYTTPLQLSLIEVLAIGFFCVTLFASVALVGAIIIVLLARVQARLLPGARAHFRTVVSRMLRQADPEGSVAATIWVFAVVGPTALVVVVLLPMELLHAATPLSVAGALVANAYLAAAIPIGLIAVMGWFPLRSLLRRRASGSAASRLVSPRSASVALGITVLVTLIALHSLTADLRRAVDFRWSGSLLCFVVLGVLSVRMVDQLGHGRYVWIVSAMVLVGLPVSMSSFGRYENVHLAINRYAPVARRLTNALTKLSDLDHDGHGSLLGARDCSPHDSSIHPGAIDRPNDGIDQNCDGSDLSGSAVVRSTPAWSPHRARPPPSIVLLSVDALRPDYLGAHAQRELGGTPNLDRFFRQAVVFDKAYAPAPVTLMSLSSAFSGRHPSELVWTFHGTNRSLGTRNVTLAEMFVKLGYETRAHVATGYMMRGRDFYQGFQFRDSPPAAVRSVADEGVAQRAITWLDQRTSNKPFLLWVHLFSPHHPYRKHDEFDFGDGMEARYLSEVAYVDVLIGRLLHAIDTRFPNAVVVFLSDHGESFNEHGRYYHGKDLYEEALRVPLAIRAPAFAPVRIATKVSLVDLTPTLLDVVGASPDPSMSGRSLLASLKHGVEPEGRTLFFEVLPEPRHPEHLRGVLLGDVKLVHNVRLNIRELYRLDLDPMERLNLYDRDRPLAARMEDVLSETLARISLVHYGRPETSARAD